MINLNYHSFFQKGVKMINLREFASNQEGKYDEIATGEVEIKKSKFYCYIFPAYNDESINSIISKIKKDNKKARHVVYAYKYFDEGNILKSKFSNDSEPQGTGVNSIISMLEKEDVNNYLVVIVRYFGGTLLGAGLLLRSYLTAFKNAYKKINKSS